MAMLRLDFFSRLADLWHNVRHIRAADIPKLDGGLRPWLSRRWLRLVRLKSWRSSTGGMGHGCWTPCTVRSWRAGIVRRGDCRPTHKAGATTQGPLENSDITEKVRAAATNGCELQPTV